MGLAISGALLVLSAALSVYAVDAIASSGRGAVWWRRIGATVTVILLAAGLLLVGRAVADDRSTLSAGIALLAAGGLLGIILWNSGRAVIVRLLPLDSESPRDWLGLLAIGWFLIFNSVAFDIDAEAESTAITTSEAVIQMLMFVGITCGIVGLFVRRDLRQSFARLGIRRLDASGIAIAVGAVIPVATLSALSALLVDYIQPGVLDRLEETVSGMTGGETSLQLGLLLGITAAIGEEALFRGALQPKYGLIFTSLVFALLHAQYDLLLVVGSLFPVGLILGLERKYLGTTAAIITHALYNMLSVVGAS